MERILVIDDERAIRNTLKEVLEFEEYQVEVAQNAEEALEKLKEKIITLPAKQRDALYLHVTENMSVKEIASLLGLSSETVKKRIQRARKKLRELMGECDG